MDIGRIIIIDERVRTVEEDTRRMKHLIIDSIEMEMLIEDNVSIRLYTGNSCGVSDTFSMALPAAQWEKKQTAAVGRRVCKRTPYSGSVKIHALNQCVKLGHEWMMILRIEQFTWTRSRIE